MSGEEQKEEVAVDCGPIPVTLLEVPLGKHWWSSYINAITLQQHGVGTADVKRLQAAGFYTVESIAFSTKKALTAVKGVSDTKADKILAAGLILVPVC